MSSQNNNSVTLRIDNREVRAEKGSVLMEVIRAQGTDVPSMCYLEDTDHFTSCMVCVVRDNRSGKIIPSCSVRAEEGMDITSLDAEVEEARRMALELLLSEHVGDCEAPCQITCPAHMDIPLMNRLLAAGEFAEALQVVRRDIALPSVLGRVCPAPCEGACRRKTIDEAVSICLLKRYAGDFDLADHRMPVTDPGTMAPVSGKKVTDPGMMAPVSGKKVTDPGTMASVSGKKVTDPGTMAPVSGKTVTIIGAGPAGLAAAYHLALRGHACTVVDRNPVAGGSLLKETTPEELPREVLQKEIGFIGESGVVFRLGEPVNAERFRELQQNSDAVVIATGKGESGVNEWGLSMGTKGIGADNNTYRVDDTAVFVAGSALKPSRMAIRALGQGKEAAFSVDQYLRGAPVTGEKFLFNSRFGKLAQEEFAEYLKESHAGKRLEPVSLPEGFTAAQVMEEAARCLHCDCRDLHTCRLRIYSDRYRADQKRFKPDERQHCIKYDQHDSVIYEPSKCIKCGVCVRITEKYREPFGMTFIGRGFDVRIGIPFNEPLQEGLRVAALAAAEACPTGALSCKSVKSVKRGDPATIPEEDHLK